METSPETGCEETNASDTSDSDHPASPFQIVVNSSCMKLYNAMLMTRQTRQTLQTCVQSGVLSRKRALVRKNLVRHTVSRLDRTHGGAVGVLLPWCCSLKPTRLNSAVLSELGAPLLEGIIIWDVKVPQRDALVRIFIILMN